MRRIIFADTLFWVAVINPKDQWHEKAVSVETNLDDCSFVTTEVVLIEVLNYFCAYGEEMRLKTVRVIDAILAREDIETVWQAPEIFLKAKDYYASRLDKGYSLTDCISMNVCREHNVTEILTHDHHFTQEGFRVLL